MSKYTTELRYICEMNSGFSLYELPDKKPEEIIEAARPKIFDFPFPIYDEELRIPLELKILRHFYTREIAVETAGLWKWRLQTRLIEIMPKYNKMYEMEYKTLSINGINNVDITINRDSEAHLKATSRDNSSSETKDAFNDTPQGGLSDVEELNYLTDYRDTKNTGLTTGESGSDSSGNEFTREFGYRGGKSIYELLKDFSENVFNIDQLILMELNDLFFLLY